jgi:hypothetical protein
LCQCQCPNEKNNYGESPLETKDYIIIVLAITSFLLLVVLVMVDCYWIRKWKRNKDNTRPTENFKINIQVRDWSLFISGEGPAKR